MGRGLSKLQRFILAEAASRRRVHYADILIGYFHWEPILKLSRYALGDKTGGFLGFPEKVMTEEDVGVLAYPGGQKFSKKEIGEKNYRAAMASLSRSVRKLANRGFLTIIEGAYAKWTAVEITGEGRECIKANTKESFPQC